MDTRIEKLKKMLDKHCRHFQDTFIDEDTNEEFVVERSEIINWDLSDEERGLIEDIAADVKRLSNEEMFEFDKAICSYKYRPFDEIYIEYLRRGEKDSWAESIENPTVLQELCEKGNRYAAYKLYDKYWWGDEKNGIFIDRKQARKYYDLAGEIPYKAEWSDDDDPGEEVPGNYEYVLTGSDTALSAVKELINELCKRFGTPDNEFGLYVPQRMLMRVLVGSNTEFYRGNILTMEQTAPDQLVITSEADRGEPLLYALREVFPNIEVEMKETEW